MTGTEHGLLHITHNFVCNFINFCLPDDKKLPTSGHSGVHGPPRFHTSLGTCEGDREASGAVAAAAGRGRVAQGGGAQAHGARAQAEPVRGKYTGNRKIKTC